MKSLRICMEKYIDELYYNCCFSFHDYLVKDDMYNNKNPVYEIHNASSTKTNTNVLLIGCSSYHIIETTRNFLKRLSEYERRHKKRFVLYIDKNMPLCINNKNALDIDHLDNIIDSCDYTVIPLQKM